MNKILEQIEQQISAKVSPANKNAFDRTVLAGEKIMFDPKTHAHMEMVKNPDAMKDPVATVSTGVAGLMWIMYMQSHQKMPLEVLILAGTVLMTKAFDFAERGLSVPVDNTMVAATTKKLAENLFTKLGISPDQLAQQIAKGKAEIDANQSGDNTGQGNPANAMQGAA